jgi:kynurenine formamidase
VDKIDGIVTRGVLLDIARFKGVSHLNKGEVITMKDLISCAETEKVEFRVGDAVLIRTGVIETFDKKNPTEFFRGTPGIGMSTVELFDRIGTAVLGSDTYSIEVEPTERGDFSVPLHEELLWKRGIYMIELLNLDKIASDKVYEFLFVGAPLKIEKGLGSPINPLAIC